MIATLPHGLEEALKLTFSRIEPLAVVRVDLMDGLQRALAEDVVAKVDSPSIDASMKDGYAVNSDQVGEASREHPVRLKLVDCLAAGDRRGVRVEPGTAVRVLTGARIPSGADAVVAEEFTSVGDGYVHVFKHGEPGRNILARSSDVAKGQTVAVKGTAVTPGLAGLLAAAGLSHLTVVRPPSVAIIATGDEVVAPGLPLPRGSLYASNMTTLGGWCYKYGMPTRMTVVKDDEAALYDLLADRVETADAIVTSGGAWTGDRDLVVRVLERLGWQQVFHRIRIGPGKAVGFGLLRSKPIFILPGGPPSNLVGFLEIALPGLLCMAGHQPPGLPEIKVRLASDITGRHKDWTQFVFGTFENRAEALLFRSIKAKSRLRSMAEAQAVVAIPEGQTVLEAGTLVSAQLLV